MIDQERLNGDYLFFTTGDESKLTKTSIYTRIKNHYGHLDDIYSKAPNHQYADYAQSIGLGYNKPCIQRLVITPNHVHIVFDRVDTEQLPYDIECIKRLLGPDNTYTFEGKIKDATHIP